jgi:hypothetical protein
MTTFPSITISVSCQKGLWLAREAATGKSFEFSHLPDLFRFAASQCPEGTVSYELARSTTIEERMEFGEAHYQMSWLQGC